MFFQNMWKWLTKSEAPLSMVKSLLHPLSFNAKSHFKFPNFCTQIEALSKTPLARGVATEFFIKKCGLTDEDLKTFRHRNKLLRAKSRQNMEEVLELLNGYGLTAPERIRRVVLCNPQILFSNLKAKLNFLRTFMKEEDVGTLILRNARIFTYSERTFKSAISLFQKIGIEGDALSHLVARQPPLLVSSEEKLMELFKLAEGFGLKKGSKMFAIAVRVILGVGKENLDKKLQFWSSLGFSEKQISVLLRRRPLTLEISDEKLKRNVDFIVKTVGLPLADIVKYPDLFANSLETRMIPRYRVLEALKSMQVPVSNRRLCFPAIMRLTEKRFLEKYVDLNAESSSVLHDIYYGGKAGKSMIEKETCSEPVTCRKIHKSGEN